MQIEENKGAAAADQAPGQREGFDFTALGVTDQTFAKLKSAEQ